MFTIKYQTYNLASQQPVNGPANYDRCEQIHGPFGLVSQEMEGGYTVVYAHQGDAPGMTFGPNRGRELLEGETPPPRSTLWVMNEAGATVATYQL